MFPKVIQKTQKSMGWHIFIHLDYSNLAPSTEGDFTSSSVDQITENVTWNCETVHFF